MDIDLLFRQHEATLRRVCQRIVGERDADDIVQETLIRAMTRAPATQDHLRPWLVTVARNLALNHLRRAQRLESHEESELEATADATNPQVNPEVVLSHREDHVAAVLHAINVLSPTERSVVFLREMLGLNPPEVAEVLGLSAGSVRVIHSRARRTLESEHAVPGGGADAATESSVEALEQFVTWLLTRVVVETVRDPENRVNGLLSAHLSLADAVLQLARAGTNPRVHARALLCRGNILRLLARYDGAKQDLIAAAGVAEVAQDRTLAALAHARLAAVVYHTEGSRPAIEILDLVLASPAMNATDVVLVRTLRVQCLLAMHCLEEAVDEIREIQRGLDTVEGSNDHLFVLNQAGVAHLYAGRYDKAIAVLSDMKELSEQRDETRGLAAATCNLGAAIFAVGDTVLARRELDASLGLARKCGDRRLEGMALANLAMVDQDVGDLASAAVRYEQAMAVHVEVGNRRGVGITLFNAAICDQGRGRCAVALRKMKEALAILEEVDHDVMFLFAAVFIAGAEAELDAPGARQRLVEVRAAAVTEGRMACVAACETLEGFFDLHAGDRQAVERRLAAAEVRWPEVRTAVLLVSQARDRLDAEGATSTGLRPRR